MMQIIKNKNLDHLVSTLLDPKCCSHLQYLHEMLGAGFQINGSEGTRYVLVNMLSENKPDRFDAAMLITTCIATVKELTTSAKTALENEEVPK